MSIENHNIFFSGEFLINSCVCDLLNNSSLMEADFGFTNILYSDSKLIKNYCFLFTVFNITARGKETFLWNFPFSPPVIRGTTLRHFWCHHFPRPYQLQLFFHPHFTYLGFYLSSNSKSKHSSKFHNTA